jgi:hypothetical protein
MLNEVKHLVPLQGLVRFFASLRVTAKGPLRSMLFRSLLLPSCPRHRRVNFVSFVLYGLSRQLKTLAGSHMPLTNGALRRRLVCLAGRDAGPK